MRAAFGIFGDMAINITRWEEAKNRIIGEDRARVQIGTLSEKTVHAVVKNYYEPNEDRQEIPIEGKCADIYIAPKCGIDCLDENGTKGRIIEIQTRQWEKLKTKLDLFLPEYDVTLVLPIPDHKQIIWIDPDTGELGKPGPNRKYAKMHTGFEEVYKIRKYLEHPHLHVVFLYMDMIEYKLLTGRSRDRKRFGAMRYDRIPTELKEEVVLECKEDYMMFIPEDLPEQFTSADFAKIAGISARLTGYVLGVLRITGNIEQIGKSGRANLYRIKE